MICARYTEAKNKFLNSYDANKSTSYVLNVDVNDLYGHSMMQMFRIGRRNCVNLITKSDIKIVPTSKQYIKWQFRLTYKRGNNFKMEQ